MNYILISKNRSCNERIFLKKIDNNNYIKITENRRKTKYSYCFEPVVCVEHEFDDDLYEVIIDPVIVSYIGGNMISFFNENYKLLMSKF